MQQFNLNVQIRWSDLDPNFHLRHSIYYDWGALSRIGFLEQNGLTTHLMAKLNFGPILFREECVFKREIHLNDPVTINLELVKARKDYSRWTIQHTIFKNPETIAAILTCDGAWLDTTLRKLASPPAEVTQVFGSMPLHANFQMTE
jgi:acyl-CoA thioester hydrolase